MNNILNNRVKDKNGYRLYETVELLKYDEKLFEGTSLAGKGIQKTVTLALMALLDDTTGEISGLVTVLPILYKNLFDLYRANEKIEEELTSNNPSIATLEKLRTDLSTDVIDILNAIVIALPIPVVDTVAIPIINMLEDSITTGTASSVTYLFKKLTQSQPKLAKILQIISYPFGGPIILRALENIDHLSEENIMSTINGIIDQTSQPDPMIDITPRQNELPDNSAAKQIALSESKINRWHLLSGIEQ